MEEAEQAFSHIFELQSRIERMNTELSERTDYESEYYQELIERVSNANEQLALIGASNYQAEIEKTLIGLGFTREDFGRDTSEFSGGGVCVSNWRSCCYSVPMCFCSMSLPTIWI